MITPAPTATIASDTGAENYDSQACSKMERGKSAQAEFDRFVTGLFRTTARPGARPRVTPGTPSITAETIQRHALEVLDREGAQALNLRRMADDLKISTRTLYKRIGNRESLIRRAVDMHYRHLDLHLDLQPRGAWDVTAKQWCRQIHLVLRAHPHVTVLMIDECTQLVDSYATDLTELAVAQGLAATTASACCTALIRVTVNDAIRKCSIPSAWELQTPEVMTDEFNREVSTVIDWILAGVCAT